MSITRKLKERIRTAVRTRKEIKELTALLDEQTLAKPQVQALTPIATPASATAEDCATKINAIIAALKA